MTRGAVSALPESARKYAETKVFTDATVPQALLDRHETKPGVWGRIVVLGGCLTYIRNPGPSEQVERLGSGNFGIIRPAEPHRVAPDGAVRFKVEFLRVPET